jgi:hypothetical protein
MDHLAIRSQIISLVEATEPGDSASLDGLVALVYDESKAIAHHYLARELTTRCRPRASCTRRT